jgi:hypothetical protein
LSAPGLKPEAHGFGVATHTFSTSIEPHGFVLMKMVFASIFATVLIVAMTLGAMFTLVRATVYVTSIESPAQRAIAIGAEIVLGVVLLLGTTWLATHLAVRIFHNKEAAALGAPLA